MTKNPDTTILPIDEIREIAESMGFIYRADGRLHSMTNMWITFTYPNTNTHVIMINCPLTKKELMLELANQLVRCGKIQQRQKFLQEFSPFNYGD